MRLFMFIKLSKMRFRGKCFIFISLVCNSKTILLFPGDLPGDTARKKACGLLPQDFLPTAP